LSDTDSQRFQAYLNFRQQLFDGRQAAYAAFDRTILNLSSGSLGLSLAFISDVADSPRWVTLLYGSWSLFLIAIISILGSFVTSQKSFDMQQENADEYYIDRKEEALTRPNRFSQWTQRLNYVAGATFIAGLIATAIFVGGNLTTSRLEVPKEKKTMSDKPEFSERNVRTEKFGEAAPRMILAPREEKGAPAPQMIRVPRQQGALAPQMIRVPTQVSEGQAAPAQGNTSSGAGTAGEKK
jgi:hypothetical protein